MRSDCVTLNKSRQTAINWVHHAVPIEVPLATAASMSRCQASAQPSPRILACRGKLASTAVNRSPNKRRRHPARRCHSSLLSGSATSTSKVRPAPHRNSAAPSSKSRQRPNRSVGEIKVLRKSCSYPRSCGHLRTRHAIAPCRCPVPVVWGSPP
jgi:hypothetical protein